jgi:hypothetical protein
MAEGTTGQGRGWAPKANPTPRSGQPRTTPDAASSPNTEPPASTTPWMASTRPAGSRASISRVPGAPPRMSQAATAGFVGEHHGDAGEGAQVLGIADAEAGNVGDEVERPGPSGIHARR